MVRMASYRMADLRIVDAPVLSQESITDDVKMPTGGLGNFSIRLGDIVWYVVTKEQLANKNYVDLSSKGVKDSLDEHIADKANPHQVTKAQVGLGSVDNTADIDKPVSNAVNSAIITATTDMATKAYVNQQGNLKADKATTLSGYNINDAYTKTETDSKISALSSTTYAGHKGYATLVAAQATQASLSANTLVEVTNDSDSTKNGVYLWDGTTLTKSNNDVLGQAKTYTDTKTQGITQKSMSDFAFTVSDKDDNIAFGIAKDGTVKVSELSVQKTITQTVSIDKTVQSTDTDLAFSITDSAKNIAVAVKKTGEMVTASLETNELKVAGKKLSDIVGTNYSVGNYPFNLVHFEVFGQSLSQGAYSTPILTTSQKYDNVMFSGGIRPQHPSHDAPNFYADFIPLVEAADISGYVGYETPLGGATEAVKQLIKNENGITFDKQKYQLLGTACGEGGMSIATLSTTYLNNNLKPAITNAFNLCQSKGLTYGLPLMGWVQGEEDNKPSTGTTIQQYKDRLQNLISLVDAHLKTLDSNLALNGVITTQLCSFKTSGRTEPHIELAIYQAAIATNTNVYLACPLYIFDYKDGYHVDGISSKWMGAYIGLVHKRVLVDGQDWKPVHPISHVKQGAILEVKFHVPVQPLVFDTNWIAQNTNYGFTLVDSSNNPITINSVSITQGDIVKFITATPIPSGAKLRYAWTPVASPNRGTGARGNLRDSQGDKIVFDPTGINKRMDNWCPIFEYTIN